MEGQNLSGQLADWSISDLLQIMQVTKKTGSLDIEGARRGRVHFVDGAVTGAELSGDRGSYRGSDRGAIADILYVLSTLESGSFAVGPADGPDSEGYVVEDIMGEVAALRSLEGEVIDAGLFEAAGVRLVRELGEPITMQPDDWQVLVSLVQPFTFELCGMMRCHWTVQSTCTSSSSRRFSKARTCFLRSSTSAARACFSYSSSIILSLCLP